MYLIILSCAMDDIPVMLCESKDRAIETITQMNTTENIEWVLKKFCHLSRCDPTEPVCWKLASFHAGDLDEISIIIGEDDLPE